MLTTKVKLVFASSYYRAYLFTQNFDLGMYDMKIRLVYNSPCKRTKNLQSINHLMRLKISLAKEIGTCRILLWKNLKVTKCYYGIRSIRPLKLRVLNFIFYSLEKNIFIKIKNLQIVFNKI